MIFGKEFRGDVPKFYVEGLKYITQNPKEGIFRMCGSKKEITKLKKTLDKGKSINISKSKVHDIAGLVLQWLREYPVDIITDEFVNKSKKYENNEEKLKKFLKKELKSFKKVNKEILFHVLQCCYVLSSVKKTKMDFKNFSICVTPNIFKNVMDIAMTMSIMRLIEIYIEHFPYFFDITPPEEKEVKEEKEKGDGKKTSEKNSKEELKSMVNYKGYLSGGQKKVKSGDDFKKFKEKIKEQRDKDLELKNEEKKKQERLEQERMMKMRSTLLDIDVEKKKITGEIVNDKERALKEVIDEEEKKRERRRKRKEKKKKSRHNVVTKEKKKPETKKDRFQKAKKKVEMKKKKKKERSERYKTKINDLERQIISLKDEKRDMDENFKLIKGRISEIFEKEIVELKQANQLKENLIRTYLMKINDLETEKINLKKENKEKDKIIQELKKK